MAMQIKLTILAQGTEKFTQAKTAIDGVDNATKNSSKSAENYAKSLQSLGSRINVLGQRMTGMLTLPLVLFANTAIDTAVEVNKAWNSFHNSFAGTEQDFSNLQKTASDFSSKFGISQENVAESMKTFYLAGITDKATLESLTNTALVTSKTFQIDVTDSTKMAQQAYFSFNQTADEVAMSMATLDAIATQTTGTTQDVAVMLTNAGAAASLTGFSMTDLASASAVFSSAGFAAGKAGNAMRTILLYINSSARASAAGLSQFNIDTKSTAWTSLDAEGKLQALAKAYVAIGDNKEKLDAFAESTKALFGVQQSGPAIKLIQDMAKEYDNLSSTQSQYFKGQAIGADKTSILEFENKKLAKTLESSSNKLDIQNQMYRNQEVIIGNKLLPVKLKLLEVMTGILDKFTKLSPQMQNFILITLGIIAVAGPILMVIGLFTTLAGFIDDAVLAVGEFGASIGAGMLPALGIIIGVLALVSGTIYLLYQAWTNNWGGIQEKTKSAMEAIVNFYNQYLVPLWEEMKKRFEPMVQFFKDNWENIKGIFSGAMQAIWGIFQVAWAIFSGIVKVSIDIFTGNWGKAWEDIKNIFAGVGEGLKNIWEGVWKGIFSTINIYVNYISDKIDSIIDKFNELRGKQRDVSGKDGGGGFNNGGIVNAFNNGGLVYAANGFLSKGRDTVPAMLSPGEMVLNKSQQATMFEMLSGKSQMQTAGGPTINISVGNMIASRGEQREFARKIQELLNEDNSRK